MPEYFKGGEATSSVGIKSRNLSFSFDSHYVIGHPSYNAPRTAQKFRPRYLAPPFLCKEIFNCWIFCIIQPWNDSTMFSLEPLLLGSHFTSGKRSSRLREWIGEGGEEGWMFERWPNLETYKLMLRPWRILLKRVPRTSPGNTNYFAISALTSLRR